MDSNIDLGKMGIGKLFRMYFVPTLVGMLSMCAVTATDGVFIGRGVGSDGVAAVNIVWAPMMVLIGVGLMLGVGCSVLASVLLARGKDEDARTQVSQAIAAATGIAILFCVVMLVNPEATVRVLGSSDALLPLTISYLVWFTPALVFNVWAIVGLFVMRLDGSPKLAMWCNIVPGLLNALLDYVFIFPLDMGIMGGALATAISVFVGGVAAIIYLGWFARSLRLMRSAFSREAMSRFWRNIGNQSRIGVSALLGEATMAMLMFVGNQVFMHYLGDDGVAAFGIACYYCPFIFMIGNAIAQSAQPIISYNYGLGRRDRVAQAERLALITAAVCAVVVTCCFVWLPAAMTGLFIDSTSPAAAIATSGLPWFATAVVFYIFNLTAIGYFQSVEQAMASVAFALMRGALFLVPSFIILPKLAGVVGIWLALAVSEALTSLCIVARWLWGRHAVKRSINRPC